MNEKPKVYLCWVTHEWKRYNTYETETTVVGIFSTNCAAVKAGRDYMEYLILKHIDDDGCARFYDEDEYKVGIRDFVVDNIVV